MSNDSIQPGAREFATTRWSIVLAANGGDSHARAALGELCERYWYPLYAFVRRHGRAPHDAQDLTQEFFARLIGKDWLAEVARERGRFRSWLLAAMRHFLANEWDRQLAKKRGGGVAPISIDNDTAESRYQREPATSDDEAIYDRRWALTLIERVMVALRDEYAGAGKLTAFDALKGTLTGDAPPLAQIAAALGSTEGAVKVAAHRLRSRYRELVRAEIAETVATPGEIDGEMRHLLAVLSS